MTQATTTRTNTPRRAHPAAVRAALRSRPAHRLSKVTDSRSAKDLNYFWTPGGQLSAMVDNDAIPHATVYQYDPVGRLSGLWAPNNDYVSFVYDAGGRMTEKWLPNGVSTHYSWNTDNTLAQLTNRFNNTATVSQHDYSYDGVGQRKTAQDKVGSYAPATPDEAYGYDPVGNRLTKTASGAALYYVVDAANQLKEIRQTNATGALLTALIYDDNGNLTAKCEGSGVTTTGTSCTGSTVTQLTYDALNQLVQVAKTGLATQTYTYDDQGRRIGKSVGGSATQYLYNGSAIHGEYSATSWSQASTVYTQGTHTDEPLIRVAANDTRYFHQDGLGSVVATTDSSGAINAAQLYDAWGNPYQGAKLGSIPQYGYTGREPDETGMVYCRARYYDPTIGRFTQRDPIGLRGGLNQYAYVGNSPVNFTDQSGLAPGDVYAVTSDGSFKDSLSLFGQKVYGAGGTGYVHVATEINPLDNGTRQVAESLPKGGVQITSFDTFYNRNVSNGSSIDRYQPVNPYNNDQLTTRIQL